MATPNIPQTHKAIITTAVRTPLSEADYPTVAPVDNEVLIRMSWTASTPLNLHQADGGLLVAHPQCLGGTTVGTVVAVGPAAKRFKVGDRVFGYTWRNDKEKAMQQYITAPEFLFAKTPAGIDERALATVPDSFVTAWHTLTQECKIELPWPIPEGYVNPIRDEPILVWGGSGSVGQFVLQTLKLYGFANIVATASRRHHEMVKKFGAKEAVDYRDSDVVSQVKAAAAGKPFKYIIDCIGNLDGTVKPIAQIAEPGATAAIMLPVIVRDATDDLPPVYAMDVREDTTWKDGVNTIGVRTHFYLNVSISLSRLVSVCELTIRQNAFNAEHLQPEIMPTVIGSGAVHPTNFRVVEGKTMVERANNMLGILRRKEVSAERLVWRLNEQD
jgi:NADPH:quinone reductase-like Zn-dependent oxidoreductase